MPQERFRCARSYSLAPSPALPGHPCACPREQPTSCSLERRPLTTACLSLTNAVRARYLRASLALDGALQSTTSQRVSARGFDRTRAAPLSSCSSRPIRRRRSRLCMTDIAMTRRRTGTHFLECTQPVTRSTVETTLYHSRARLPWRIGWHPSPPTQSTVSSPGRRCCRNATTRWSEHRAAAQSWDVNPDRSGERNRQVLQP